MNIDTPSGTPEQSSYTSAGENMNTGSHHSPLASMPWTTGGLQQVSANNKEALFSANVMTLLELVNSLPDGIERSQGASIIRTTMQSMAKATGLTVENILSEAHQNQSDILGIIQKNLQKIEECQNLIASLETDIQTKQEHASKLFDLIDLFMMPSSTSTLKTET